MENVLEIFEYVAEKENLKIGNLEKMIGASKGVLSRAMKNGTDVQTKWFISLVENFPNYNYGKLLKGEFSTEDVTKANSEEPSVEYDTNVTLLGLKKDINTIYEGLTTNFSTLSKGMFHLLQDSQEIKRFISTLDPDEINNASKGLNDFLKEHK